MTVNVTELLAQWRNGDRGLPSYAEMVEVEKQLTAQAARIAELEGDLSTFKHGYRVASDNCVRLEAMLERLKRQHPITEGAA